MRITIVLAALLLARAGPAQTSVADLAEPPPSAQHFTILSTAGKHGESARCRRRLLGQAGVRRLAREAGRLLRPDDILPPAERPCLKGMPRHAD
jgi:hypothetical protein